MVDQGEGFLLYHTECPGLVSPTDLLHPHPQLHKVHTGIWRLQLLPKHLLSASDAVRETTLESIIQVTLQVRLEKGQVSGLLLLL